MGRRKKKSANTHFFKVKATFKCSSDSCNKQWTSVHGWAREEVFCTFCTSKAELTKAVDEQIELDTFSCRGENCGNIWQTIHGESEGGQECDKCGEIASREGTQFRFGRHYWFTCPTEKCKGNANWEDFSTEKIHTQRCGYCQSRGDIIATQKLKPLPPGVWRKKREVGPDGNSRSTHNSELCDMCQDLRKQGTFGNCRGYRKVKYQAEEDAGGQTTLRIISAK